MRRLLLTILGTLMMISALALPVAAQECEMPPPPPPPASTPSA